LFTLKTTQTITQNTVSRNEEFCERKSFDSSDMMYLLMPDRFANGNNNNDSENNTKKNTTENYLAEDTVAILKEL
jgi:hypothetical protein